jgi:hypothetical protein
MYKKNLKKKLFRHVSVGNHENKIVILAGQFSSVLKHLQFPANDSGECGGG